MPNYIASGIYIEETSFRAKSIEGVGTSTAAFVGSARCGAVTLASSLVTSLTEFERLYGDGRPLVWGGGQPVVNDLWHAARAFFDEGGQRLYISRVFRPLSGVYPTDLRLPWAGQGPHADGHARAQVTKPGAPPSGFRIIARQPGAAGNVRVRFDVMPDVTLTMTVSRVDDGQQIAIYAGLPSQPVHATAGKADSLFDRFGVDAAGDGGVVSPVVLINDGLGQAADLLAALNQVNHEVVLSGGNDGLAPLAADHGEALQHLESVEDVSLVAAPAAGTDVAKLLVQHAQKMRYRLALVDVPAGASVGDARQYRAQFDSAFGALFYPWVLVDDPVTRQPLALPPSGFVAGLYARHDVERGVYKAPANEALRSVKGVSVALNTTQAEALNPDHVNVIRPLTGRGIRLWGARTLSTDPQWLYVPVRRYVSFLEQSIDKGTQWAVFEPQGEALWGQLIQSVSDFLYAQWRQGALLGAKPELAYFVRCDRTTMTQADLDSGRVVILVGVALIKPAEFLLFRVGQRTAL